MLRHLLLRFGRKKDPAFALAPELTGGYLLAFAAERGLAWLRSSRLLLRGYRPRLLFLGRRVRLSGLRWLQLGRGVQIHEGVSIKAFGRKGLHIGAYSTIGAYSRLHVSYGLEPGEGIHIGEQVGIGEFAHLGGGGGLEIGDGCIIGPYLSCHPENHRFDDLEQPIRRQGVSRQGIRIGPGCWIGAKVTILDGVEIGPGCVIAAGAVVTQSMPAHSIIGGVPAKVIRSRIPTPLTTV
ncbi:MAG: acyltransferase [Bacteroidetes bacterium]|nr:MAG: acyltransferase [Bacteroidota bacterium]